MKMSASSYIKDLNEAFDKYFENVSPMLTEMCDQLIEIRRKSAARGLGQGGSKDVQESLSKIIDELMFVKNDDTTKTVYIDQDAVSTFVNMIMGNRSILSTINNFNDQKITFVNHQPIVSLVDRVENEVVSLHRRIQKAITGAIENAIGIDNKSIYDQGKLIELVKLRIFTSNGFGIFKKAVENNERKLMYSKIEDDKDLRKRVGAELKKLISKTNDDNQDFKPLVDEAFKGNTNEVGIALKKLIINTISNLKVYESEFHKFSEKIDAIFRESSIQSILKKVHLYVSDDASKKYSLMSGSQIECPNDQTKLFEIIYNEAKMENKNTIRSLSSLDMTTLDKLISGIKELIPKQYKDVSEFLKLIKDISEMDISPKMFISLIFSIYYLNAFEVEDEKLGNLVALVKNLCESTLTALYNVLNIFVSPSKVVGNIVAVSGGATLFTADNEQVFAPTEFKPQLKEVYLKAPYIIRAFDDLSTSKEDVLSKYNTYKFLKFNTVENSKWRDLYLNLCPKQEENKEKVRSSIVASTVVNYINQIAEGFSGDNIAKDMINDLISTYTISIRKAFEDTSGKYGEDVDGILEDIQNNTQPNMVKRIKEIIEVYKTFIGDSDEANALERLKQRSQVTKIINTYNFDINKARNNLERATILQDYLNKDFSEYFDSNAKIFSSYATTVYALYYLLNMVCEGIELKITEEKEGEVVKRNVDSEIIIKSNEDWEKAENMINLSMTLTDGGNMMIDTKNSSLTISFTPIYNKINLMFQKIESIKRKFVFNTNLDINENELNEQKKDYIGQIEDSVIDKIKDLSKLKTIKIEGLEPFNINAIQLKIKDPQLKDVTDKRYAFKTKLNDVQKKILETDLAKNNSNVGSIFADYDLSAYIPYQYEKINNSFMGEILNKFNKINDGLFKSVNRLVIPIEFIESLKNNGFDFVIDPLAQSPFVFNSPTLLYAAISNRLIKASEDNSPLDPSKIKISYNPDPLSNEFKNLDLNEDIKLITKQKQIIIPWLFKYTANALSVSNKMVISMMDAYSLNRHVECILMVLELVTDSIAMIEIIGGTEEIKQNLYPTKNSLSSFRTVLSDYLRNILSDNNVVNKLFTDHIESMSNVDHYSVDIQKEYRWVAYITKFVPNFDVDRLIEKIKVAVVDSLDMPKDALIESFKCMAELYNYTFEMKGGKLYQNYDIIFKGDKIGSLENKIFNVINTIPDLSKGVIYKKTDAIYHYPKESEEKSKQDFYKAFLKTLNINLAIPISILNETGFASILVLGTCDKRNGINVCNFTTRVNEAFNVFLTNIVNSKINIKIAGKNNNELVNAYNLIYNGDSLNLHGGSSESEPDMMKVIAKVRKALAKEGLTLNDVIEAKPKFEELQNASANGLKQFITIMLEYFNSGNINGQPSKDLIDLIKRIAHTKADANLSTEQLIQLLAAVFMAYKDDNDSQKIIMKNFKLIKANKISKQEIIDMIRSITDKDLMIIVCTDDDVADIW